MRKPRDIDSELKALSDKAKLLKERKVKQLGELVIAVGADTLDAETLAGALLTAAQSKDTRQREAWRKSGAGFFCKPSRKGSPEQRRGTARKAEAHVVGNQTDTSDDALG